MDKFIEERKKVIADMRSMLETAKGETRGLNADEKSKYEKMEARANELKEIISAESRAVEMEKELRDMPAPKVEVIGVNEFRNLGKLMGEKRAITVSGTGAVTVVPEIVKEMLAKSALLARFKYFYGSAYNTNIPVLSPGVAVPVGTAESATAVTGADTTAVLGVKTLTPKAYISSLPVSAETLLMSGSNFEASLPGVFADAFGSAMLSGSLVGAGTTNAMAGLFLSASATKSVAQGTLTSAPKLIDLVKLALEIQNYTDNGVILINSTFIGNMIGEATTGSDPIKAELLANRTVMGVPVIVTSIAPTTVTTGSTTAVALDPANYAIGVAQELVITPKQVPGNPATYFDATMFFDGRVIAAANVIKLTA